MRPGEKLYEELLAGGKNQEKTENNLIFIERGPARSELEMMKMLDDLKIAVESGNHKNVYDSLHCCAPEFRRPEEVNADFMDIERENSMKLDETIELLRDVELEVRKLVGSVNF